MASSSNNVTLRRATINDIDSLKNFYDTYFSDKPVLLDMETWKWSFPSNPFKHSGLPFFVIEDNGVIKGGIGYLSVKFNINNGQSTGAHPVNFFVAPGYAGFPALRLLRMVTAENSISYASYYSDDAEKLIIAAKWVNLSPYIHDYFFPLNPPYLNKLSPKYIAAQTKKSLRMTWIMLLKLLLSIGTKQAHKKVKRHEHFSEKLYPSNNQPTNNYCGVHRDIEFINWRYANSPRLNCVYFSLVNNNIKSALAIVHLDTQNNRAVILDLIESDCDNKSLQLLFIDIIIFCNSKRFKLLSTSLLNIKIDKILRKLVFGVRKSSFGLMYYTQNNDHKSVLKDPTHWDFWIGHSDVY